MANSYNILHVQVGFTLGIPILTIDAAIDQFNREALSGDLEMVLIVIKIGILSGFIQETTKTNPASGLNVHGIVAHIVQLFHARGGDRLFARGSCGALDRSWGVGGSSSRVMMLDGGSFDGFAKVGGRGDQVNVAGEMIGDRVLGSAQLGNTIVFKVSKLGAKELVGGSNIGGEINGFTGGVDILDTGSFQPRNDRSTVCSREQCFELVMIKVFAILWASGS